MDPLKYIYEKTYLSSRIIRWKVLLLEYDIVYMTRKAIKGSVIIDHLVDQTVDDYEPLNFDLLNKNMPITSQEKKQYPILIRLQFKFTNNTTEYKAYIIYLKAILKLKVRKIDVYGNSLLIICQVKGEWQIKDETLKSYQDYLLKLANEFEEIKFTHISRDKNQFTDVLATLASMTQINIWSRI